MEVEWLLLLRVEEAQYLDQYLPHLGIQLDVILGLLAHTEREHFQRLIDLIITILFRQVLLHGVKYIKELK